MLKGFRRWLRIVVLMIGFMSGGLSLIRELLAIYAPQRIQSASLFWHCVWIAFILSSFSAWFLEYRRSESLEQDLLKAKARPSFTGHLYQFNIHPRTGIAPPEMLQQAVDIAADRRGEPRKEILVDCDVFIETHIVNQNPGVGTVLDYEAEIEVNGQIVRPRSESSFLGWVEMKPSYRIDAITGNKVDENLNWQDVPDLMKRTVNPMLQGHGAEGWLHFVLENVNPLKLQANPPKIKAVTAIDGYGMKHEITQGWIGPRHTVIGPDVQKAQEN